MKTAIMNYVPKSVLSKVSRGLLKAKKNSPHIFFAAGVVGSVASTVLACRATLKLSDTLDEIEQDVTEFRRKNDEGAPANTDVVPDSKWRQEATYVYGMAGLKIVRLYAPAAAIGVISIGALTGSHVQLVRRNTALMAAYAAVQKAYDEYRERVREEYGEEKELDLYHAVRNETVLDTEGNKLDVKISDPNRYSPYAKFFDEYNDNWKKDPELNRIFVQCQQNYANNLLHGRGHVFLNEVYDALGIDRTRAGAVVGWVRDSDGDNYVDFGIFEAFNTAFVNGWEPSILLDFNVDGVIYDKI